MSDKEQDAAPRNDVDRWLARGGGGVAVAILIWMNTTLGSLQASVAEVKTQIVKVTTELSIVSPKDIMTQVQSIQAAALTSRDVEHIVRTKGERVQQRLSEIEARLKVLEAKQ